MFAALDSITVTLKLYLFRLRAPVCVMVMLLQLILNDYDGMIFLSRK